ncbi:MAG: cupin-like domain-containing protein [Myxococcales bacterium]|nr:cupin-like domain-containing protein [Myxococcales bacterium]
MWAFDLLPAVPTLTTPWGREPPTHPVIVREVASSWPARRWSPELLRDRHGDLVVQTYAMRDGHVLLDPRTGFVLEPMRLRDYVAHTEGTDKPRHYLRVSTTALPPSMRADLGVPSPCVDGLGLRSNFWFSGRGTVTRLHFDLPHNLVVMLHGTKRFVLFPPSDARALYAYPWISSTPHLSRVDPEAPDFARWPRLTRARGVLATLGPGDALFIPPRWWHHARSLEAAISLNFWWCDPWTYPVLLASDAYKRARGLAI